MSDLVSLVFNNKDATPKKTKIKCDKASVPAIMAWYGSYFAGDCYKVKVDGKSVRMDLNGKPLS